MSALPPNPRLEALIGEWEVEVPQFPGQRGRATFKWLDSGAYLRFHAVAPDPAPTATWIVGHDDASETYTSLRYDSRGVSRVYQLSFGEGVWKLWRGAPGFWQHFSRALSDERGSIRGAWEKSPDGSTWEHDFNRIYRRVK